MPRQSLSRRIFLLGGLVLAVVPAPAALVSRPAQVNVGAGPAAPAGWSQAIGAFFSSPKPDLSTLSPVLSSLRVLEVLASNPAAVADHPEAVAHLESATEALQRAADDVYLSLPARMTPAAEMKIAALNRPEVLARLTVAQQAVFQAEYHRLAQARRARIEAEIRAVESSWQKSAELAPVAVPGPGQEGPRLSPYLRARSLGGQAALSLKRDPSGRRLQEDVVPAFERGLADPDSDVRVMAASRVYELARLVVETGSIPHLWTRAVGPLIEKALHDPDGEVVAEMGTNLRVLLESLDLRRPTEILFGVLYAALIDRAYGEGGGRIKLIAQERLSYFVHAALKLDPSGGLLKQVILPEFERGLRSGDEVEGGPSSEDDVERFRVSSGLRDLRGALVRADKDGSLLQEVWTPLFEVFSLKGLYTADDIPMVHIEHGTLFARDRFGIYGRLFVSDRRLRGDPEGGLSPVNLALERGRVHGMAGGMGFTSRSLSLMLRDGRATGRFGEMEVALDVSEHRVTGYVGLYRVRMNFLADGSGLENYRSPRHPSIHPELMAALAVLTPIYHGGAGE